MEEHKEIFAQNCITLEKKRTGKKKKIKTKITEKFKEAIMR
jgi:hypothetical protein